MRLVLIEVKWEDFLRALSTMNHTAIAAISEIIFLTQFSINICFKSVIMR